MSITEKAKPATASAANGLQIEQLGGRLNSQNGLDPQERQVHRLSRRFGFTLETAIAVAILVWGVCPR
jgi:hypothetical protein